MKNLRRAGRAASRGAASTLLLLATLALAPIAATGCDLLEIGVKSKVADGQLYASGEGRFDLYFQKVHAEQVARKAWDADKKAAKKPVASFAGVSEGQSNAALFDALKGKASGVQYKLDADGKVAVPPKGDAALARAVEETVRLELAHAKRVKDAGARAEDLAREGDSLGNAVKERYAASGGDKEREVKRELKAAVVAMRQIARDARHEDSDTEDFVKGLGEAIGSGAPPKAAGSSGPKPSSGAGAKPPKPEPSGKPAGKTPEPLPPPKPPKPESSGATPPKPPDDDFNP